MQKESKNQAQQEKKKLHKQIKPNGRAIVYIDGLNLFYNSLKNSQTLKWLNLEHLCRLTLPTFNIQKINYYTGRVSGKIDWQAPQRQKTYIKALESLPLLTVHSRKMQMRKKIFPHASDHGERVRVLKAEEKGTDVALGAHLVRDAATGQFDVAAVLTNDTDLDEPIRIVTQEFNLPVILLTVTNKPAVSLKNLSTSTRYITRSRIERAKFPVSIPAANVVCPLKWR